MNPIAICQEVADERQRYALILQTWELANRQQNIEEVLDAVAELLAPWVSFDGIVVPAFGGERRGLFARHFRGAPSVSREEMPEFIRRMQSQCHDTTDDRPVRSYGPSPLGDCMKAGVPYHCPDLMAEPAWYRHEFRLARAGVRSFCMIPMAIHGELLGAIAFVRREVRPYTPGELRLLHEVSQPVAAAVARALVWEEARALRSQMEEEMPALPAPAAAATWSEEIAGDSSALRRVLEAVEQVAPTQATVLITGETGTGKELIARAIHHRSPRASAPMVAVHCAAVPQALQASELFGHERGAFTGAASRRVGRFEQARGGTLFLDEIGEISLETQVMLLRVLQERRFERIGGTEILQADVRLVAATHRDLPREITEGQFRSDLYYRLNVFPIRVPPLRERREDIPVLAMRFVSRHAAALGKSIERIERASLRLLEAYDWPGNVRELENVIERAVILARGRTLRIHREMMEGAVPATNLEEQLQDQERRAIEAALKACRGRIWGPNGAARRLGLAPSTLDFRRKRLGIDTLQFRSS